MRSLIVSIYRLVYNITRFKLFSFVVAIAYITLLNLVMVYGLGLLLEGWMPTSIVHKLFAFPLIIFTTGLMTYLIYKATPPRKSISKDAKKTTSYTAILVYTGLCALIFAYIKYNDKVFVDPAPKRKKFKNPHNAYNNLKNPSKTVCYVSQPPQIAANSNHPLLKTAGEV